MSIYTILGTYTSTPTQHEINGLSMVNDGKNSNTAGSYNTNAQYFDVNKHPNVSLPNYKTMLRWSSLDTIFPANSKIVKCTLNLHKYNAGNTTNRTVGIYRTLKNWTTAANYRYYDGVTTWYLNTYGMMSDRDYDSTTIASFVSYSTDPVGSLYTIDISSNLRWALDNGTTTLDMVLIDNTIGNTSDVNPLRLYGNGHTSVSLRPYLEVWYYKPITVFKSLGDASRSIDLSSPLHNELDLDTYKGDLGSVKQGEVGSTKKFFVKNMTASDIGWIEAWDDSPEWIKPIEHTTVAGGSTASLSRVLLTPLLTASGKLTLTFTTSTAYNVVHAAYGDNTVSYGTQNAGSTLSDYSNTAAGGSSAGMYRILSTYWSGTAVAGDVFTVYVRGDTTPSSYTADSGDLVYFTTDAGWPGSYDTDVADSTKWQNIRTHRTTISGTNPLGDPYLNLYPPTDSMAVEDIGYIRNTAGEYERTVLSGVSPSGVLLDASKTYSYADGDKFSTCMPLGPLQAATLAAVDVVSGPDQTYPTRLYVDSTTGFSPGNTIYVQDGIQAEGLTVASVASMDYLVATTTISGTYQPGALVLNYSTDGSYRSFYMRCEPTATSAYGRRIVRLSIEEI